MNGQDSEFLLFELGGQAYALPTALVQEIIRAVMIAPIPDSPPLVEGVIHYRGAPLPVLDLRRRFDATSRPVEPSDHFIVCRIASRRFALHVDRAREVVRIAPDAVADVNTSGTQQSAGGMGVARIADQLVIIEDPARILSLLGTQGIALGLEPAHGGKTS